MKLNIQEILDKHASWLKGGSECGEKANLRGANLWGADLWDANLRGANLEGADLWGANLEGANGNLTHMKSVFCEKYQVTYTADVMQIGCQRHKISDWWKFDDNTILKMDGKQALKWWRTWKPLLQQVIATSPAKPTSREAEGGES